MKLKDVEEEIRDISLDLYDFDNKSISEVIQFLTEIEQKGLTLGYNRIFLKEDSGWEHSRLEVWGRRKETAKEWRTRLDKAKKARMQNRILIEKKEEEERVLFTRLQKKYG